MKHLFFALILGLTLTFTACNSDNPNRPQKKSVAVDAVEQRSQVPTGELELSYEELPINEFIDEYAGHPMDPQLPQEFYGSLDNEVLDLFPQDLRRLMNDGKRYALEQQKTPRYLFAIGRVAYLHEYPDAFQLLSLAAQKGSKAAYAYIGYTLMDQGRPEEALVAFEKAAEGNFTDSYMNAMKQLASENIFNPNSFNRPAYIKALYDNNIDAIRNDQLVQFYIGAIQNTLWSNDILFLTDDPKLMLELDPRISAKEGRKVENEISNALRAFGQLAGGMLNGSDMPRSLLVVEEGTQDARRLALLYSHNPTAFRKIYAGMKKFSQN